MGRQNQLGLELSFHKSTKRWCKVVSGKRIYFGSGKSPSDRASYRKALSKYREYMDGQYHEELIVQATQQATQRILQFQAQRARQWLEQAELGIMHTMGASSLSAKELATQPTRGRKLAA